MYLRYIILYTNATYITCIFIFIISTPPPHQKHTGYTVTVLTRFRRTDCVVLQNIVILPARRRPVSIKRRGALRQTYYIVYLYKSEHENTFITVTVIGVRQNSFITHRDITIE